MAYKILWTTPVHISALTSEAKFQIPGPNQFPNRIISPLGLHHRVMGGLWYCTYVLYLFSLTKQIPTREELDISFADFADSRGNP